MAKRRTTSRRRRTTSNKRRRTSSTRYRRRSGYSRKRTMGRRRLVRRRYRRRRLVINNGLVPKKKLHTIVGRTDFYQASRSWTGTVYSNLFQYTPANFNPNDIADTEVYWPTYLEKYLGFANSGAFYNTLKKNGHDFKVSISAPYYETTSQRKVIVPGYFYAFNFRSRGEALETFGIISAWESSTTKFETLHDLLRSQPNLKKYRYITPQGTISSSKAHFKYRNRMNYRKFYRQNFRSANAAPAVNQINDKTTENYFFYNASRPLGTVPITYANAFDTRPSISSSGTDAAPFPYVFIYWVPEDSDLVTGQTIQWTINIAIKNFITLEGVNPYRPISNQTVMPRQTGIGEQEEQEELPMEQEQ